MATTQAVLDELGDETLQLIIALQLEDAASVERENNDGYLEPSDNTTACRLFADELRQFREVHRYEGEETKLAETLVAATFAQPDVECVSCQDQLPSDETFRVSCSHHYCIRCVEQLHRLCMTDESLFPPGCCRREMPWEAVSVKIDGELATEYTKKKEELGTLADQRTYCSDPACSKFIGAALIDNDVATCTTCSKATCVKCKTAQHGGDCPEDEAMQQTLQLAKDEGWQRCNKCGSMIDLAFGCYHMTCPCRHQFCYICGVDWKTCVCPQWDDERLEARAEQIVDRRPAAGAAERAELILQEAGRLIERHNCAHEEWTRVRGAAVCEECTHNLPLFTMVCDQCRLRVCHRCMQNRL